MKLPYTLARLAAIPPQSPGIVGMCIGNQLMGWKLLIAFVVFLAVGAGALAFYGSRVAPASHGYEQVLPDSRFPK
jgi:hypothetical protein